MNSDSNAKSVKDVQAYTYDATWIFTVNLRDFQTSSSQHWKTSDFYAKNNNSVKWSSIIQLTFSYFTNSIADLRLVLTTEIINSNEVEDQSSYGGEVSFRVDQSNLNVSITCKKTFVLNKDSPTIHVSLSQENLRLLRVENFNIISHIIFFKLHDVIPVFVSLAENNTKDTPNVLEDFGKLYLNEELSDVTICIKSEGNESKPYPAHKSILACRSKVFEGMFRHKMRENQLGRVVVEDINEDVFLEVLRFIYTGCIENLETLVFELLLVADRYDIEKLKIICEKTLNKKLSVETAVKILILADMCNVGDLKTKAVQFIQNHSDVVKKMDSKAWTDLMSRPHLMKEMLLSNVYNY